jgi:alpha-mannosidase
VPRRAGSPSEREIAAALEGTPYQILGRRQDGERLDSARHYPDQDEVEVVRVALATPELGGFGMASRESSELSGGRVLAGPRWLDNDVLEVAVAPDGLIRLMDRRTGAHYQRLLSLESEGDAGDTYSFAPAVDETGQATAAWSSIRRLATGPLVAALEVRATLRSGRVQARMVLSLYAGSPLLRCTIDLDNTATNHRLRLRVPTGRADSYSLAGGPFGPVRRAVRVTDTGRYPREAPVATAPAHRFVAVGGSEGGLAILAPGFFEYEHTRTGDLVVSLLRCVGQLSREDLSTRPGNAGWPTATPEAQCIGRERLQLALAPVSAEDIERAAPLTALWEDAFVPPRAIWLRQATELDPPATDVRLEGDGLVFSSLKPATGGGGIVFRCYNATGSEVAGRVVFATPVAAVARARADERAPQPLPLDVERTSVELDAGPHEIVTLLLTPA